jgi:hypothetical protein
VENIRGRGKFTAPLPGYLSGSTRFIYYAVKSSLPKQPFLSLRRFYHICLFPAKRHELDHPVFTSLHFVTMFLQSKVAISLTCSLLVDAESMRSLNKRRIICSVRLHISNIVIGMGDYRRGLDW